MTNPYISIIVPVYNSEKYLRRCVDSILAQDYGNFELLLIDDGSIDNSGNICDEYASLDARVKVFHKVNGGVSTARNVGVDNAKGKWITFVDSDDFIEKSYLNIGDSTADIIFQNYVTTGTSEKSKYAKMKISNLESLKDFLNNEAHKELFRTPWGKFFKKSIIKEHDLRFNTKYSIGEDTLFILEYMCYCVSLDFLSTSYYCYQKGDAIQKYTINSRCALMYMNDFYRLYLAIGLNNIRYLQFIYESFYMLMKPQCNVYESNVWFKNILTRKIYNKIFFSLRLKAHIFYLNQRIKCILYTIHN